MPYSTISNFTFDPQLAAEYASAAFVENLALLARATGIVRIAGVGEFNSSLGQGGQFIDLPYFGNVADLVSRRDVDSTSVPNDLDITGLEDKAVILRRKAGPVKFTEDVFIRGISPRNVEHEIGVQIGNAAALEVRKSLLTVVRAALVSLDTPSANCHISDIYNDTVGVNLTFARLNTGRMLLKDAYNKLTHVVMHSHVFADLVADGITNYKIENVAGLTIVTGHPAAFGMTIIVVDDDSLRIENPTKLYRYRTMLFGQHALSLIYHQRLRIEAERRLDFEAPYWRVLGNFDFAPHLNGMKWVSSSANPDNTDLATSANWDEAYNDHRQVLAAEIIHNATPD